MSPTCQKGMRSSYEILLHSLFLLFFSTLLVACGLAPSRLAPTPTTTDGYAINPLFREFYSYLGGEAVLGRAIQPADCTASACTQLLEKAKLVYDRNASVSRYFTLAPVGIEMGIVEAAVPEPNQVGARWVDGHVVAPEFVPLYERIGGFAGKPLTEARFDSYSRRYIQYFENIGMYRQEGRNEVHLLDYGVWACNCDEKLVWLLGRTEQPLNSTVDIYSKIDPAFEPFVKQLGIEFTGFAISEAYLNQEGRWEQIFQNMVLVANTPDNAASAHPRAMVREINLTPDLPMTASGKEDMHFEAVSGAHGAANGAALVGYDVPDFFWEYMTNHGGLEMSGAPITRLAPLNGQVLHQCFENLCLMFDLNASPTRQVYPEPLGQSYKTLNYNKSRARQTVGGGGVKLVIWQRYPVLAFDQVQEIGVSVVEDEKPLAGVVPSLSLTKPGNVTQELAFPATDANGRSILRLGPFEASNGDRMSYSVCLPLANGKQHCTGDSFVMWNNP